MGTARTRHRFEGVVQACRVGLGFPEVLHLEPAQREGGVAGDRKATIRILPHHSSKASRVLLSLIGPILRRIQDYFFKEDLRKQERRARSDLSALILRFCPYLSTLQSRMSLFLLMFSRIMATRLHSPSPSNLPAPFICTAFPSFVLNSHFHHQALLLYTNKHRPHTSHAALLPIHPTHKWEKTKQAQAPSLLLPPHEAVAPSSSFSSLRFFLPLFLLSLLLLLLLLPTEAGLRCDRRWGGREGGRGKGENRQ